jgi:subtilisin family serine protease
MSKQLAIFVSFLCVVVGCRKSEPEAVVPLVLVVKPRLPELSSADRNHNKVTDTLEASATGEGQQKVVVVFTERPGAEQRDAFAKLGGTIDYEFRNVSYGFIGRLPSSHIAQLPNAMGDTLHVVTELWPTGRTGDVELRQARVRSVWPTTRGSTNTTIAIFDTGIDATHPDFAGRQLFWKDYSTSGHPTPVDVNGHGSHVSGLALGSGAAFDNPTYNGALRVTDTDNTTQVSIPFITPGPMTMRYGAVFNSSSPVSFYVSRTLLDGGAFSSTLYADAGSPLTVAPMTLGGGLRTNALLLTSDNSDFVSSLTLSADGYPRDPAYPTLSGVAPVSPWYVGKVFADDDANDGSELLMALDELVDNRIANKVKVLNLSLAAICPDGDIAGRAAVLTLVDNGVTVVAAAGNRGPTEV